MFFYKYKGLMLFSLKDEYGFTKITKEQALAEGKEIYYLYTGKPGETKASFLLNRPAMLYENQENISWLNDNCWQDKTAALKPAIDNSLKEFINAGKVMAVNTSYPGYLQFLQDAANNFKKSPNKKRVNILALGDVGGTLLMGLRLLGGDIIESIGIYDINPKICRRWEMEINQITPPWDYNSLPEVEIIGEDELFSGDMLIFCPSVGVPPLGKEQGDIRMAQFSGNKKIIAHYAKEAANKDFKGIFAVISDPVDLLCKAAFLASNLGENGDYTWLGLRPEQIKGYGLGVMNSRGAYYAKKEKGLAGFLREGRAYGPHGEGLVLANSIENYNDKASKELTKLAVKANLAIREAGFKPYIAPALSSGAISIIRTLKGQWHYSANFLAGIYMGAKNRDTARGPEFEVLPLPEALFKRIESAAEGLAKINCGPEA